MICPPILSHTECGTPRSNARALIENRAKSQPDSSFPALSAAWSSSCPGFSGSCLLPLSLTDGPAPRARTSDADKVMPRSVNVGNGLSTSSAAEHPSTCQTTDHGQHSAPGHPGQSSTSLMAVGRLVSGMGVLTVLHWFIFIRF